MSPLPSAAQPRMQKIIEPMGWIKIHLHFSLCFKIFQKLILKVFFKETINLKMVL